MICDGLRYSFWRALFGGCRRPVAYALHDGTDRDGLFLWRMLCKKHADLADPHRLYSIGTAREFHLRQLTERA